MTLLLFRTLVLISNETVSLKLLYSEGVAIAQKNGTLY